jgi:glycosyltransferase involved in cell wall biosynthesis
MCGDRPAGELVRGSWHAHKRRVREAMSDLRDLELSARETARRLVRSSPDAAWETRLDLAGWAGRLASGLREALVDAPAPRYAVRLSRPPAAGPRPRILHVIPNVLVGGSTQLLVDLHERLGHAYAMEVLTETLPPGGPHSGMTIGRLSREAPADRFAAAVAASRPDLVHLHYWGSHDAPWYEAALEAVFAARVPLVQNVNTPVEPLRDNRIAATVFVSRYVRETFGREITRARIIHPGIDLGAFAPPSASDPDAQDTALMVYRLDRDKLDPDSILPLVDAVKRRPRTRVVVVGLGPLLFEFLRLVEAAGVRANFDFRGYVPYRELPAIYAQARLFVAPVARESFGQVVPFAMAMGLAVAGNRVGALPEILGTSETLGSTPEETGAIIAGLLDDPARLDRLGAANRHRASAFDVEDMAGAYADLYASVLQAGVRGGQA